MNLSEEKPPFFESWSGLYWALTIFTIILIILFYFLTQSLT